MRNAYFVEVTDTFGGEANYTWVHRFKVSATTQRGAMRKIANRFGGYGSIRKDFDTGDMQRWVWKNACMCAFIEHYDNQAETVRSIESI